MTFNTWFYYWVSHYKEPSNTKTYVKRLKSVYKCQLQDNIGDIQLSCLTTDELQDIIYSFATGSGGQCLAQSGLKKIRDLLKPCLRQAVENGYIRVNPADKLIIPREEYIEKATKEQVTMTDEEIEDFKHACLKRCVTNNNLYRHKDGLIFLLILNTGMRVGEALALEWDDVTDDYIIVNKHIAGYEVVKGTKTNRGRRIPTNDTIRKILSEIKEYNRFCGIESKYICSTKTGTRLLYSNLVRSLGRIMKHTSIKKMITVHTLRHTFGSTLLRRGVDIKVVSELMGHSNVSITMNVYIHVLEEQKIQSMRMISVSGI